MEKTKILALDDDTAICASIRLLLKRSGFDCRTVSRPIDLFPALEESMPQLLLLDMNFTIDTSGRKGMEILRKVRSEYPKLPIILMTGWATVQLAVEGMKAGARDFIAKPWENKQLLSSIRTILELEQPATSNHSLDRLPASFDQLVGEDPAFRDVLAVAQRVSRTNASVLIFGESGTGKELIAEAIHYESERCEQPFVKVNLGGISTSLFESELFGHKKGAFTDAATDRKGRFEMADTGTIFLDEIGELPMANQVKLLRVLQEHTFEVLGSSQSQKVDIRVISATNKDLEEKVNQGGFREDLYYRINLIKITIPPLRERRSDIPLLVHFFIQNLKTIYQRPNISINADALEWLSQQNFPGNIRQLKNLVERTVLINPSDQLTASDFQIQYREKLSPKDQIELPQVGRISLEEMEIMMIKKALDFHHNKVSPTARALGLTRSALYRRLQKYNIPYVD